MSGLSSAFHVCAFVGIGTPAIATKNFGDA
jgi:hypothetical protein